LIELLVVMAIIGALSSVVISSVAEAREEAYNAKVLQEVHQYVIAIQMAYDENGEYPDPGDDNFSYCLGEPYPSGGCSFNGSVGLLATAPNGADAMDQIKQYYNGYPSVIDRISSGFGDVWGYEYRCVDRTTGQCNRVEMQWFLKNASENCGRYDADGTAQTIGDTSICTADSDTW